MRGAASSSVVAYVAPAPSVDLHDAVCAVMVTHCIGKSLLQVIPPLLEQIDHLVIVDNCSDDGTRRVLADLHSQYQGRVEVLLRDANNLAAAQNDGIGRALDQGYGWVLLMDHDSIPVHGMVHTMKHAYHHHAAHGEIGLIAPCLTDIHSGRQARYPQARGRMGCKRVGFGESELLDNLLGAVASGSLIPAHVFSRVGRMDESLCIDYVDKEFCLRVVRAGLRIIAVRDAVLRHQLGHSRDHHLLGMKVTTTNHSPDRCYYIYRNRFKSWGKHGASLPAFVMYDALAMGYDLLRLALFEEQKFAKLRAMLRGMRDAARGVSGAINTVAESQA